VFTCALAALPGNATYSTTNTTITSHHDTLTSWAACIDQRHCRQLHSNFYFQLQHKPIDASLDKSSVKKITIAYLFYRAECFIPYDAQVPVARLYAVE
jgi:hypothetical protein